MAGRRRTRAEAEATDLAATQRAARPNNRRLALAGKWATAPGPGGRAVEAARYVQGALARRQPDAARAEQVARRVDEVALQMVALGDELLGVQAAEPLRIDRRGHAA